MLHENYQQLLFEADLKVAQKELKNLHMLYSKIKKDANAGDREANALEAQLIRTGSAIDSFTEQFTDRSGKNDPTIRHGTAANQMVQQFAALKKSVINLIGL